MFMNNYSIFGSVIIRSLLHNIGLYLIDSILCLLFHIVHESFCRKHVIKKRAQTLIAPIEENDEPTVLTATTICDEEVRTRRTSSIKGFLRRGTADLKLRTKKPVENQTGQSHSVSKVTAMNNEQRNDALAKLSLQLIDK